MYYYLLSIGEYSDYRATGLYKSSVDINKEKIAQYYIDYAKSLGINPESLGNYNCLDDYFLKQAYMKDVCHKMRPEREFYQDVEKFYKEYDEYTDVLREKTKDISFEKYLIETGGLEKLDYQEFNMTR